MRITLAGPPETAEGSIATVLRAAGWSVAERCGHGARLLLPDGETDPARGVWLLCRPVADGTEIVLWLTDEAPHPALGALHAGLAGLVSPNGDPDGSLLRRLRRIEGQIRGLQRMISADQDCEAILTQFLAVTAALKQTAANLVSEHLIECVRDELERGGEPGSINKKLLNILF